jgi:hypothetical protein
MICPRSMDMAMFHPRTGKAAPDPGVGTTPVDRLSDEGRAQPGRVLDAVVLAGLTILVSLPFLFSGAGFYREDWKALADARSSGWWAAGGVVVARRPLGAVVYALVYGGIGNHPRAAFAAVLAVNVAVTVMLLVVARQLLDRWTAAAIVFVFVLLPSRSSLVHWVNGMALEVGLLVLLIGTALLLRALRQDRISWIGVAVMAASTLIYDPTVILAAAVLVIGPRLVAGRFRRDLVVAAALLIAVRVPWSFLTASGRAEPISLRAAFASNFGWGIVAAPRLSTLLQALVLIGLGVTGLRTVQGRARRDREGLVVAGSIIFLAGMLPFLQTGADIDFIGIGDRANFIAAIGAACIFVGLIRMLPVPAPGTIVLVVALGLACLPLRVQQDHRWEQTWSASAKLLDQASTRLASHHRHLTYGPDIIACGGVEGVSGDASDALHVWTGTSSGSLTFAPTTASTTPDHLSTQGIRCTPP